MYIYTTMQPVASAHCLPMEAVEAFDTQLYEVNVVCHQSNILYSHSTLIIDLQLAS